MNLYLSKAFPSVSVDATARFHRYLNLDEEAGYVTYSFQLDCRVKNETGILDAAYFCCREDYGSPEHCQQLQSKGNLSCGSVSYSYDYDPRNGPVFEYTRKTHTAIAKVERKGVISCKVVKDDVMIQSNEIEIRDRYYFWSQLENAGDISKYTIVPQLYDLDMPAVFDCLQPEDREKVNAWPEWMLQFLSFNRPFHYGLYTLEEINDSEKLSGSSFISARGLLYLTKGEFFQLKDYVIICRNSFNAAPLRSFYGPLYLSNVKRKALFYSRGLPSNASDYTLKALTPLVQNIELGVQSKLRNFMLSASYERSKEGANHQWTKDGKDYTVTATTANTLLLDDLVTEQMSGEYKLSVVDKVDISKRINFIYHVKVVGPPQFENINCLNYQTYIVEGENFRSVCNLNKPADIVIAVNGIMGTSTSQLKTKIQDQLLTTNNRLSKLDISLLKINDGQKVELDVNQIQAGQDFRLSLQASNDHGKSLLEAFLYVVPKPKLATYPSYMNCEVDCDLTSFTLEAQLDPHYESELFIKFNINYTVDWLINEEFSTESANSGIFNFIHFNRAYPHNITIFPYQRSANKTEEISDLSSSSTEVPIFAKPVNQAKSLREFLVISRKDPDIDQLQVKVVYKFYVMNAASQIIHSEKIVAPEYESEKNALQKLGGRLIYDSKFETDPNVNAILTSTRKFTPRVSSSSTPLIAAVIMGIIILLVIVILSVWLCNRTKRSTYEMRVTEHTNGLDPESDMLMEKPFKPLVLETDACLQHQETEVHSDEGGELDIYYGEDLKKKPIVKPSIFK